MLLRQNSSSCMMCSTDMMVLCCILMSCSSLFMMICMDCPASTEVNRTVTSYDVNAFPCVEFYVLYVFYEFLGVVYMVCRMSDQWFE